MSAHFLYSNFFFSNASFEEKNTKTINNRIRIHIVTNYLRSAARERRDSEIKKNWCKNEMMEVNNRQNPFQSLTTNSFGSFVILILYWEFETKDTVNGRMRERETPSKPQFNEDSIFQQVFKDRPCSFLRHSKCDKTIMKEFVSANLSNYDLTTTTCES